MESWRQWADHSHMLVAGQSLSPRGSCRFASRTTIVSPDNLRVTVRSEPQPVLYWRAVGGRRANYARSLTRPKTAGAWSDQTRSWAVRRNLPLR